MNGLLTIFGATALVAVLSGAASGGTVHPAAHDDIVDIAAGSESFTTLTAAVKAAGLVEILKSDGPFTVFAPTDEAFAALPAGALEALLRPENRAKLRGILTFHVIEGRVPASDLLAASSAETANGKPLPIGLRVGDAKVIKTDIAASNGIIHVIDRVLLPTDIVARRTPAKLIEMAISRGAPLYNHGQQAACAAVYEMTAEALLMSDQVTGPARTALEDALARMSRTHDADSQAWIMRRGLDQAYASMMNSAQDNY